jgi:hypothetical protein
MLLNIIIKDNDFLDDTANDSTILEDNISKLYYLTKT